MSTTLHRIQDERLAATLALLIAAAALAIANFGGSGDNGGAGVYAVSVGVCAVLSAVLFGRVLPNAADDLLKDGERLPARDPIERGSPRR